MMISTIKTKEKKNTWIYMLITMIVIFMGCLRNGNLNLIYFVIPIVFIIAIKRNKKVFSKMLVLFIPFLFIFIMTTFYSKYFTNINKSLIYLLKLLLCVSLFSSLRYSKYSLDFYKILRYLEYTIFGLTIVAIVTQNNYLWRFNDIVNKYTSTRLQLFFQEPSELSEVCGILLIIHLYYLKIGKTKDFFKLAFIIIPLILSAGLSGLVYSVISIIIFFILTEIQTLKKAKISKIFLIFIFCVIGIVMLVTLFPENAIMKRIVAVLNGEDGSFNYRFTRAWEALKHILIETKYLGVGLGNIRTQFMNNYLFENFNLLSFSNSYLFFFAEGGLIAIIYICLLVIGLLARIKKLNVPYYNKCLRISLLFFIVIIQITGGYFTDPFLWGILGLIGSKYFLMEENKK